MKIEDIKAYPINVGSGVQLVVKVETEGGIYGWGASGLSGRELAVVGAIKHFKTFLIGRDARQIESLWQEMYRGQYFEGGRVLTAAISAIDIALYDIKGKALGVPVYELLGGKQRDFIECFASIRFTTRDELLSYSKTCVKEGWNMLRLAPAEFESQENKSVFDARHSIAIMAEWVTELRKEVGKEITIGIDYHTRLTAAETYAFIQRMPKGTLDFIEEPIRDESPIAYKSLRRMIDTPFAIGEEFSSKWQFAPFIESNLTQYARIDVCNVGGFTESKKVASMAETHYIDLMPHNPLGPICTAATIHLAAATPNFSWLEEVNTPAQYMGTNAPEFYPVQPKLEGPRYRVPDGPGLGVEFNEALAIEREFVPVDIPRLWRKDGSLTNW
ncbi:mandelate racemase/muconate lactonizing enzyme family protein [Flavivirga rizhaonensis]|uniref:Mandelate racemase/muconate lactonizing enzyme family protein n=1 Tax=Flavivirga rizhaonensis TaxID=2559571 RepID=A0A4S1DYF2_9FLAO|nr:mandelate racemase/muconate lactonizing enzyme family protein [Flavivirga rizhaonensis]TGV02588.1 mandelate racemase/muconate lactonizing enzyme family protein [Flavivirga rizhaonensis]